MRAKVTLPLVAKASYAVHAVKYAAIFQTLIVSGKCRISKTIINRAWTAKREREMLMTICCSGVQPGEDAALAYPQNGLMSPFSRSLRCFRLFDELGHLIPRKTLLDRSSFGDLKIFKPDLCCCLL